MKAHFGQQRICFSGIESVGISSTVSTSPPSTPATFLEPPPMFNTDMGNYDDQSTTQHNSLPPSGTTPFYSQNNSFNQFTPTPMSTIQIENSTSISPYFQQNPHPASPPSPQTAAFNFTDMTVSNPSSPYYDYNSGSLPKFTPINLVGKVVDHSDHTPPGIRISIQPKLYQIVNYNIYPSPEVEFSRTFNEPVTVQSSLIYKDENGNTIDIPEGFTNGDVQVLKVGQTRVSFPALHLNRMTPIKNAVQQGGGSLGHNFCVIFKIGDVSLASNPFKLVSACNQIPEDQVDVRPRKQKEKPNQTSSSKSSVLSPPINSDDFLLTTPTSSNSFNSSAIPSKVTAKSTPSGKRRATDDVTSQQGLAWSV